MFLLKYEFKNRLEDTLLNNAFYSFDEFGVAEKDRSEDGR